VRRVLAAGGTAAAWAKLSGRAVELATLYEGARFFSAVPASLPDAILQIGDLADPAHAALFPKIIRGLSMDAMIHRVDRRGAGI
jgi:hypothetical protein